MVEVVDLTKKGRVFGVNFRLEEGALALVGPNGAGKTTVLNLLVGRLKPDAGEVRIFGHPPRSLEAARERAYVPQQIAFPLHLRVREVLAAAQALAQVGDDAREEATHRMGLTPYLNAFVGNLSGGYRQRLALAAGLMGEKKLWLLDEPASALDPGGFARLVEWTREHKEKGGLLIVSAHRPDEVEAFADEALLLSAGRVRWRGPVERLYTYRLPDGRRLEEVLPGVRVVREPVDVLREVLYEEESA